MIAFNGENGIPQPSNGSGGGGALLERPDNLRSDAKLIAKMISLGVIPIEEAESLLRQGLALAGECATTKNARGYSACMKIALECAKLAQNERHKFIDKNLPDLHEHSTTERQSVAELLNEPNYVEWLRECQRDSDPRLIRSNGQQGHSDPLDDGSARNGD